jgi:TatD DNase family protein
MFIDVHCHLDDFENIDEIVENAKKANVLIAVAQGTNAEDNKIVLQLAKTYPEIKAALGLYPVESLKLNDSELKAVVNNIEKNKDKIVAIGEVGLDLKMTNELEKQQKAFQQMIDLSLRLDKPIIVHSRKAELVCIEQLEKSKAKKVIMHCFSGKLSAVKRIIENGWYLSIPTSVKNLLHFQEVIKMTPIGQLFCETDSPYLHPDRGFPNEPANVVVSYEKIAEIKNLKLSEVEKQIEKNYKKLFE